MGTYRIEGGYPLCGEITLHGAKNSVLPILAATAAVGAPCVIHRCPKIRDVEALLLILRQLGARIRWSDHSLYIDTSDLQEKPIDPELMRRTRGGILFLGALTARFGSACLSVPGGCALGVRPIDLHLRGLRLLGAQIRQEGSCLTCTAPVLTGIPIALPFPSVGATENMILAALRCQGTMTLCNAAKEPEIADLLDFLQAAGAEVYGQGSSIVMVRGGKPLHGTQFTLMPDRMEAATYLCAAAAAGGCLTLREAEPAHLTAVTEILRRAGCGIQSKGSCLTLRAGALRSVSPICTAPYDGFPTDAQAPMMAVMAVARGVSVFEETVFSDRFRHVPALCAMGARIRATRRYAVVQGTERLHGAEVTATDLRGGAAMAVAALAAEGTTILRDTVHLERGYEEFVETLRSVGAEITKDEDNEQEKGTQFTGCPDGSAQPRGT